MILSQKRIDQAAFQEYSAHARILNFRFGNMLMMMSSITEAVVSFIFLHKVSVPIFLIIVAFYHGILTALTMQKRYPVFLLNMDTLATAGLIGHFLAKTIDVITIGSKSAIPQMTPFVSLFVVSIWKLPLLHAIGACGMCTFPLFAASFATNYALRTDYFVVIYNYLLWLAMTLNTVISSVWLQEAGYAAFTSARKITKAQGVLSAQQSKNAELLENLFPPIIRELVDTTTATNCNQATVVFGNLENFAQVTAQLPASESIDLLNKVFVLLDSLATKHGLLKIKTTGETYMAVSGIPERAAMDTVHCVQFALDALDGIRVLASTVALPLLPRFGVNTGFVVAGCLHTSRIAFDLYGDAVNVAHRMMLHDIPGAVQVSQSALHALPPGVRAQVLGDSSAQEATCHEASAQAEAVPSPTSSEAAHAGHADLDEAPLPPSARASTPPGLPLAHTQATTDAFEGPMTIRSSSLGGASARTARTESLSVGTATARNSAQTARTELEWPEDIEATCASWVVAPRGSICLKHHGMMEAYLITRSSPVEAMAFPLVVPSPAFSQRSSSVVPLGPSPSPPPGSMSMSLSLPGTLPVRSTSTVDIFGTAEASPDASSTLGESLHLHPSAELDGDDLAKSVAAQQAPRVVTAASRMSPVASTSSLAFSSLQRSASGVMSLQTPHGSVATRPTHRSQGPRSQHSSSEGSSSHGMEEAIDACAFHCDASAEVMSTLRASLQHRVQLVGSEQPDGAGDLHALRQDSSSAREGVGEEYNEAEHWGDAVANSASVALRNAMTPAELARASEACASHLTMFFLFRDANTHRRYVARNLTRSIERLRLYTVLSMLCNLLFMGANIAFLPAAWTIFLSIRLVYLLPNVLVFALSYVSKKRQLLRVGVYRAMGLVQILSWTAASFVEHLLVLLLHRPALADTAAWAALQHAFYGMGICTLVVYLSPLFPFDNIVLKMTIGAAYYLATVAVCAATSPFPHIGTFICVAAIFGAESFLSTLVTRNTRLTFIQNDLQLKKFQEMKAENTRSLRLLESALPVTVLKNLRTNPHAISQKIQEATVFFADFVKFTEFCSNVPSVFVVQLLDELYGQFDSICKERGVVPIATIGDCYFAGNGVIQPDPAHVRSCVDSAIAIIRELKHVIRKKGITLAIRIGLASGEVFAGVLGVTRFTFDVWGPAVSDAKGLEASGAANSVLVSSFVKEHLPSEAFRFKRGPVVNKQAAFFVAPR